MHPNTTNVAADKIPTPDKIGSYIYRHRFRQASRAELSPINTLATNRDLEMNSALLRIERNAKVKKKKMIIKEETFMQETITVSKTYDNSNRRQSIYQRALGPFIRIEIKNNRVTSNDENFQRYGASFFTRFFGFIVQCENWYPKDLEERNMKQTSEGYETMSEFLRGALQNLVTSLEIDDEIVPLRDPMIHQYEAVVNVQTE